MAVQDAIPPEPAVETAVLPSAHLAPHLWALRKDRWVLFGMITLGLQVAFCHVLPGGQSWLQLATETLLGAALVSALWHRVDQIRQPVERLFWKDLTVATTALLAGVLLQAGPDLPMVTVAADLLYVIFFVLFVLALERRPHRHHPWRPGTLDRSLTWPPLMVFVICLLAYLVIQPLYFGSYQAQVTSPWLAWILDMFLAARLLLVAIKSTSLRWQNLYAMLAMAMGLATARDLWQAFSPPQAPQEPLGDLLLIGLPWLLMIVAARLRRRRFPSDALIEEDRADAGISSPAGQGLVFALLLPLLHIAFQASVDDPIDDLHQELLLLIGLLALGVLAYLQYQKLRTGMQGMRRERNLFEEELLESEQDLRLMVTQKQTAETLDSFARNFAEIFYRNPDAMTICGLAEGDFLEVNDAFADLYGFRRQDMMGRTALDLGLLSPDDEMDQLFHRLQQHETVRKIRVRSRDREGNPLAVDLSAQRVEISGQPCVLIVTFKHSPTLHAAMPTDWLAHGSDPAWGLDAEDRITYWNQAAEDFFGLRSENALGRAAASIFDHPAHADLSRRVLQKGGVQEESMDLVNADGQRIPVRCLYLRWWITTGPEEASENRGDDFEEAPTRAASRLGICRPAHQSGAAQT